MDNRQFWEHTASVAIGIGLGYCVIKTAEQVAGKFKVYFNSPVTEDRLERLEKILLQKAEQVQAKDN